jgi:hypothetical protein
MHLLQSARQIHWVFPQEHLNMIGKSVHVSVFLMACVMGEGPFQGAETLFQGVFVLPFVGGSECVLMAKVPQSTWAAMTRSGPLSF